RLLQLLVQVLGAADETDRRQAEAVAVQRVLGRLDQVRMVGQAQVVIGAEVQHLAPVLERDLGRLRPGDDALGLEQALFADLVQGFVVTGSQGHVGGNPAGFPNSTRRSPWRPVAAGPRRSREAFALHVPRPAPAATASSFTYAQRPPGHGGAPG